jgi:hypothetical protein
LLVKIKRDLANQIRGLLKNLGLAIGRPKFNVFAARAEELIEDRPELIAAIGQPTLILAEMLILATTMSIAGSANRPPRAPRPSPVNRELNSRRTIVPCSRCRYMRGYWRAALARELPTKRRPTEISVHPSAALMPSAGANLI